MKPKTYKLICLLLTTFLSFVSLHELANADVDVSGNIREIDPPESVNLKGLETVNIQIFKEGIYTLPAGIQTSVLSENLGPDDLSPGGKFITNSIDDIDRNKGFLPAGTVAIVYYITYDSIDDTIWNLRVGTAGFEGRILGVSLVNDRSGYFHLDDSSVFRSPTTEYPWRGNDALDMDVMERNGDFEGGGNGNGFDRIIMEQDLKTLTIEVRNRGKIDSMRVFVAAPTLSSSINPASVSEDSGANAATLTITRNTECIDESQLVNLISSIPSRASVPNTATIPANQYSIQVPIRVVEDFGNDINANVRIDVSGEYFEGSSSYLTVTPVNHPPNFPPIPLQRTVICEQFVYDVQATDPDGQLLRYELVQPFPVGATINPGSGRISWLAPEQNDVYPFTVRVTDNGVPQPISITRAFNAVVESSALTTSIDRQAIEEGDGANAANLQITRAACLDRETIVSLHSDDETEATVPHTVTFEIGQEIAIVPVGAVEDFIDDGDKVATITASADGFASSSSLVTVQSINHEPMIEPIDDQTVGACNEFVYTVLVNDPDSNDELSYELISPPSGATIDSNGVIKWTAPAATTLQFESLTVRVQDSGTPPLQDTTTFQLAIEPYAISEYPVESFGVNEGILAAGDVFSLAASDGMDLSVRRDPSNVFSVTEVEFTGQTVKSEPCVLEITIESSVFARSDVIQLLMLFDFNANQFEEVDVRAASRFVDSVVIAAFNHNPGRFVSEAGELKGRLEFRSIQNRQNFTAHIDRIYWSIGH